MRSLAAHRKNRKKGYAFVRPCMRSKAALAVCAPMLVKTLAGF